MAPKWELVPDRDLLSPNNLDRVRRACEKGPVFAWHYVYAGGGSGNLFVFNDFESYRKAVESSRRGDHFTVYSASQLAERAIPLEQARQLVAEAGEVVFVSASHAEVLSSPEEFETLPGPGVFFTIDMLDEDEQGVPIGTVSPGARKRIHAVADGKRSDDAGKTPPSGIY
jgi:hypothetical protein